MCVYLIYAEKYKINESENNTEKRKRRQQRTMRGETQGRRDEVPERRCLMIKNGGTELCERDETKKK